MVKLTDRCWLDYRPDDQKAAVRTAIFALSKTDMIDREKKGSITAAITTKNRREDLAK
jgi:hypothetical protein